MREKIKCERMEFSSRENGSLVWKYFQKLGQERAMCNVCSKVLRCKASSTSGLLCHALKIHQIEVSRQPVPAKRASTSITATTSSDCVKREKDSSDEGHIPDIQPKRSKRTALKSEDTDNRTVLKSSVWKDFSKNADGNTATCLICSKMLSCRGGSTSGLKNHAKGMHGIEHESGSKIKLPIACINTNKSVVDMAVDQKPRMSKQQQHRQQKLPEILACLIIQDKFPIKKILNSSFIRNSLILQGVSPPSSAEEVMSSLLDQEAIVRKQIEDKVLQVKSAGEKFSLTLNELLATNKGRYLVITLHYPDGDLDCLGTSRIPRKYSQNIATIVDQKLAAYGIEFASDIVAYTNDGSAVMDEFGDLTPIDTQLCYNRAIHSAVIDVFYRKCAKKQNNENDYSDESECEDNFSDEDCEGDVVYEIIDEYKEILKTVRNTIKFFKASAQRKKVLKKYVRDEHKSKMNLLLDKPYKWNSLVAMLKRFLLIQDSIAQALSELYWDNELTNENVKACEELVRILEPVEVTVKALSQSDANLLSSEGALQFLFKKLNSLNSKLSNDLVKALTLRLGQTRREDFVSLLKFLQFGNCYNDTLGQSFFTMSPRDEILRVAVELSQRLLGSSRLSKKDNVTGFSTYDEEFEFDNEDVRSPAVPDDPLSFNCMSLDEEIKREMSMCLQPSTSANPNSSSMNYDKLEQDFQILETTQTMSDNLKILFSAMKTIKATSTPAESVFSLSANRIATIENFYSDKSINCLYILKTFYNKK